MSDAAEPTVEQSLHCPMCDYDLRGQVEPRCPECGYRFDWEELRDPARRLHPYLFEHHPERNIWSMRRTFVGSMRPRRFWADLFPTQPSRPRRLLVYWVVVTLLLLVPFAAYWVYSAVQVDASDRTARSRVATWVTPQQRAAYAAQFGSYQAWLDAAYPLLPDPRVFRFALQSYWTRPIYLVALLILIWPWLTLAALMVFQASMRRTKVRAVHVLRCVIYASDGLIVAVLAVGAHFLAERLNIRVSYRPPFLFIRYVLLATAALLLYRLWIAYRTYLRFDHALATAAASQIMVGLLVWKFGLDWHMLSW